MQRTRATAVASRATSVDLDARVRELGESGIAARIINISESGFMAESEGSFEIGSRVWLMLPGRDRANAVVKWTARRQARRRVRRTDFTRGPRPRLGRRCGYPSHTTPLGSCNPAAFSLVQRAKGRSCDPDQSIVARNAHEFTTPRDGAITRSTASMRSTIARAAAVRTGLSAGFRRNAPSAQPRCRWPKRACARSRCRWSSSTRTASHRPRPGPRKGVAN